MCYIVWDGWNVSDHLTCQTLNLSQKSEAHTKIKQNDLIPEEMIKNTKNKRTLHFLYTNIVDKGVKWSAQWCANI